VCALEGTVEAGGEKKGEGTWEGGSVSVKGETGKRHMIADGNGGRGSAHYEGGRHSARVRRDIEASQKGRGSKSKLLCFMYWRPSLRGRKQCPVYMSLSRPHTSLHRTSRHLSLRLKASNRNCGHASSMTESSRAAISRLGTRTRSRGMLADRLRRKSDPSCSRRGTWSAWCQFSTKRINPRPSVRMDIRGGAQVLLGRRGHHLLIILEIQQHCWNSGSEQLWAGNTRLWTCARPIRRALLNVSRSHLKIRLGMSMPLSRTSFSAWCHVVLTNAITFNV